MRHQKEPGPRLCGDQVRVCVSGLLYRNVVHAERSRQSDVVGAAELNSHCLTGPTVEIVWSSQNVDACCAFVLIAKRCQCAQQRSRCVSHFDEESIEDRGSRSLTAGDIQPDVKIGAGRGYRDRLIERATRAVHPIDDHVSDTTVRE